MHLRSDIKNNSQRRHACIERDSIKTFARDAVVPLSCHGLAKVDLDQQECQMKHETRDNDADGGVSVSALGNETKV